MKTFDIDAMRPKALEETIERESVPGYERWTSRNGPGIKAKKLLDWRALERRYHWASTICTKFNDAYWDRIRSLSDENRRLGGDGTVMMLRDDHEHVDVYSVNRCHEGSLRTDSFTEVMKHMVNNPSLRPCVLGGDDLKEVLRLRERSYTWMRRRETMGGYFRQAIEKRIVPYVQSKENRNYSFDRSYCNRCVFVVANEGRCYVVSTDEYGRTNWEHDIAYVDETLVKDP